MTCNRVYNLTKDSRIRHEKQGTGLEVVNTLDFAAEHTKRAVMEGYKQ